MSLSPPDLPLTLLISGLLIYGAVRLYLLF
jgi:hypothetical protein